MSIGKVNNEGKVVDARKVYMVSYNSLGCVAVASSKPGSNEPAIYWDGDAAEARAQELRDANPGTEIVVAEVTPL